MKPRELVVLIRKLPNNVIAAACPSQVLRLREASKFGLESEDDEDDDLQQTKCARRRSNRLKNITLQRNTVQTLMAKRNDEQNNTDCSSMTIDVLPPDDEESKSVSLVTFQQKRSQAASRSEVLSQTESKRARIEAQMIDQANQYLADAFCQVGMSTARGSPAPANLPVATSVLHHSSNFGICGMCKKDPRTANAPNETALSTGPFRITYKPCDHHCTICGFWNKNRLLVDDHLKQAHQFRCDPCGVVFGDKNSSDLHHFEQHKQQHMCELCDRMYPSEYAYHCHVGSEMHQRALRAQNNLIRDLSGARLLVTDGAHELVVQQEAVDQRRPARERWWPKALVDICDRDPAAFKRAVVVHKGFEVTAISSPPRVPAERQIADERSGQIDQLEVQLSDRWVVVDALTSVQQQPLDVTTDPAVDHFLRNLSPNSRAFANQHIQDQSIIEVQPNPHPIEETTQLQANRRPSLTGLDLDASFDRDLLNSSMNTPRYLPHFTSSPAATTNFLNYSALERDFHESISSPLAFEMDRLNSFSSGAQPFMALLQL